MDILTWSGNSIQTIMVLLQTRHSDVHITEAESGHSGNADLLHGQTVCCIKVLPGNLIRVVASFLGLSDWCSFALTCKEFTGFLADSCEVLSGSCRFFESKRSLASALTLSRLQELQAGTVKVKRFISRKPDFQNLFHVDTMQATGFRPAIDEVTSTDVLDSLVALVNDSCLAISSPSGHLDTLAIVTHADVLAVRIIANGAAVLLVRRSCVEVYSVPLRPILTIPVGGFHIGCMHVPNPRKGVFAVCVSSMLTATYCVKAGAVRQLSSIAHNCYVKQMVIHQEKTRGVVTNFLIQLSMDGELYVNRSVLCKKGRIAFTEIRFVSNALIAFTDDFRFVVFELYRSNFQLTGCYYMPCRQVYNLSDDSVTCLGIFSHVMVFVDNSAITWFEKFGIDGVSPATKCCLPAMTKNTASVYGSYVVVRGKPAASTKESCICVAHFWGDSNAAEWVSTFR